MHYSNQLLYQIIVLHDDHVDKHVCIVPMSVPMSSETVYNTSRV